MKSEDPEYLAWVKGQSCCLCDRPPPGVAHHPTGAHLRGVGMKCPDTLAIPLCDPCHQAFHDANRQFKLWTKDMRRGWQDAQSRVTRALYLAEQRLNG